MSEIHARVTYTREDIERIKAASFHEVVPVPEAGATPAIEVMNGEDYGTLLHMPYAAGQILPHYYTSKPALSITTSVHSMEMHQVDALIAILTRARAIMQEGA